MKLKTIGVAILRCTPVILLMKVFQFQHVMNSLLHRTRIHYDRIIEANSAVITFIVYKILMF